MNDTVHFLSCPISNSMYQLLVDLANDDGTLRNLLKNDRNELTQRLGGDSDTYLPADWSLPSKEECQVFVSRYVNEARGNTHAENIQHFVGDVRCKWV